MELIVAVFVASLLGSLHCAGMCGPLVAFVLGDAQQQTTAERTALHIAYHGGRLVTYSLAGALCGLIGAAVDLGAARWGLSRAAALLAGSMMIVVGLLSIGRYAGVRLPHWNGPGGLRWLIAAGQRAALALRPVPRSLVIGLLTALLPCGWLYLFALVAAGTGSPLRGAAVMAAFWLGSVPILVALGLSVQALAGTLGRRLPLVAAVVILLLGVSTLVLRMQTPAEAFTAPPAAQGDLLKQVDALRDTTPPCCRHAKQ